MENGNIKLWISELFVWIVITYVVSYQKWKILVDNEKAEPVYFTEPWHTKHEHKFKNYKCEWKHRPNVQVEG